MRALYMVVGLILAVTLMTAFTGCKSSGANNANVSANANKPVMPPDVPAANEETRIIGISDTSTSKSSNKADTSKINWLTDFKKGQAQAAAEKKPILLDMGAEWCSWCKKLDQDTWSDKQVIAKAQKFVCIKVDIDVDPQTAKKFAVQGVPAILLLDNTGKQVARNDGYMKPADMLKFLDKMPG